MLRVKNFLSVAKTASTVSETDNCDVDRAYDMTPAMARTRNAYSKTINSS